ncbi:MAG: WbqC family protein [Bacteroidetes bacterium]|nr:WbqC family protein [Bacteroidota bacterium]
MDKILLSTAYLPPINYLSCIALADEITIEAHETYTKQTFRNRSHIYSPNGLQALIIPINKVNGNHTKTIDIQISDHSDWRLHHWKSLQTAYNTSAFFIYYKDEIRKTLQFPSSKLFEYNLHVLNFLLNEIGIKNTIKISEDYINNPSEIVDLRTSISPKSKVSINNPQYYQLYSQKYGFLENLSILDLLFNEGPNTLNYLQSMVQK